MKKTLRRRRLTTFLLSLCLASTAALATASVVAAASYGTCSDVVPQHYFAGVGVGVPNTFDGVQGYIDPDSGFHVCNAGFGDGQGGSSAWVAVESQTDPNGILQIGILHCIAASSGVCFDHPNQIMYGYAYGGCGVQPFFKYLGNADYGRHRFAMYSEGGLNAKYWDLTIDGVLTRTVDTSGSWASCWWAAAHIAAWRGEQWDASDGLGLVATNFDIMDYHNAGSWWISGITTCFGHAAVHGHTASCQRVNSYSMNIWSTY